MSADRKPLRQSYSARYWKVGGSWGVILPPDIRKYFGLKPGELMLVAVDEAQGLIVMRPARTNAVYDPSRRLRAPSLVVTEAADAEV